MFRRHWWLIKFAFVIIDEHSRVLWPSSKVPLNVVDDARLIQRPKMDTFNFNQSSARRRDGLFRLVNLDGNWFFR